jgi:hypothetical protein
LWLCLYKDKYLSLRLVRLCRQQAKAGPSGPGFFTDFRSGTSYLDFGYVSVYREKQKQTQENT